MTVGSSSLSSSESGNLRIRLTNNIINIDGFCKKCFLPFAGNCIFFGAVTDKFSQISLLNRFKKIPWCYFISWCRWLKKTIINSPKKNDWKDECDDYDEGYVGRDLGRDEIWIEVQLAINRVLHRTFWWCQIVASSVWSDPFHLRFTNCWLWRISLRPAQKLKKIQKFNNGHRLGLSLFIWTSLVDLLLQPGSTFLKNDLNDDLEEWMALIVSVEEWPDQRLFHRWRSVPWRKN